LGRALELKLGVMPEGIKVASELVYDFGTFVQKTSKFDDVFAQCARRDPRDSSAVARLSGAGPCQ
jgi:hypothetical protein